MKNKHLIDNSLLQHISIYKFACLFVHLFFLQVYWLLSQMMRTNSEKYLQDTWKKNKTEKFVPLNNLHNHIGYRLCNIVFTIKLPAFYRNQDETNV
jgi:hypothetical protein